MPSIAEFKRSLPVDKHSLDTELETHAELYFRVGDEWALSISIRDGLKEELARIDAEIYDAIVRVEEKLSDAKVRTQVMQHPDHAKAFAAWNAARLESDRWQVLHEAFRQRGSMIRQLAELFVANYYTTSSVTHSAASASNVEAERGRQAMNQDRQQRGPAPRRRERITE